jgi:transposase
MGERERRVRVAAFGQEGAVASAELRRAERYRLICRARRWCIKVTRHARPKLSCGACPKIMRPAAPSRPIERGLAGPALLAHVLVSKYSDQYRESQIFARNGIDLDRSTLADWAVRAHCSSPW